MNNLFDIEILNYNIDISTNHYQMLGFLKLGEQLGFSYIKAYTAYKYAEKIKNMKNVVILIKNDKMALNWQTPTKVIEYIKNNLEKIGTVSFFDVYITK